MKRRTIYTLPEGTTPNATIVGKLIKAHLEGYAKDYARLDSYLSDDPIMGRKSPTDEVLTIHNYANYIMAINAGYLVGQPVKYTTKDDAINIDALTENYEDQGISDLDSDLAEDCSAFGRAFENIYIDEDSQPQSVKLSVENTVVVYDNSVRHNMMFAFTFTPRVNDEGDEMEGEFDVTIWDKGYETKCKYANGVLTEEVVAPHYFGMVPIIEYANNKRFVGDYERVLKLIDAYNFLQSDRVTDREKLVDAILAFYGVDVREEDRQDIKNSRTIALPPDGKAEYIIKNIDEADADVLRSTLAADIHKFSMTPDLSDKEFAANASGVAIKFKILGFDQNIITKERYFKKGLQRRFEIYNGVLHTKSVMEQVAPHDVNIKFSRNLPQNNLEAAQTANYIAGLGVIDKETMAGWFDGVDDPQETVEKAESEQNETETKEIAPVEDNFGTNEPSEREETEPTENLEDM